MREKTTLRAVLKVQGETVLIPLCLVMKWKPLINFLQTLKIITITLRRKNLNPRKRANVVKKNSAKSCTLLQSFSSCPKSHYANV